MRTLVNAFDLLHPKLRKLIRELGYNTPTEIQNKAIPKILKDDNKNYLLIAPTGTGKTEAALFPLLSKKLEEKEIDASGIQIIYITPLRSLNRDIFRRFLPLLASKLGFSIEIRHSDTPPSRREKQARRPPFLLITTPETLQAILCGPRIRKALKNLRWVIVDEVHAIADNKRGCQLTIGLERLRELSPDISIIALSATISNEHEVLNFVTGGRGGEIIKVNYEKMFDVKIDAVDMDIKPVFSQIGFGIKVNINGIAKKIADIISKERGKILVFTNTRDMTELLGLFLKNYTNINFAIHHSSLSKNIRIDVEEKFKNGDLKCVIATSSLELGIDIGEADLVIHVMSPRRAETAIQRIGRAGHWINKVSRGIILAATPDDIYESIAIWENIKEGIIEPTRLIDKSYDVLAHQIIGIARDKYLDTGVWPKEKEVYKIIKRAWPFKNITREEFLWLLNFLYQRARLIILENKRVILRRGALRYYFQNISTIPSVLKYDVIDVTEKKKIGELDEKFVLELTRGDVFLLGGVPREVLEIDPDRKAVIVMTTYGDAVPPRWSGELLPVSFEVVQRVGKIRKLWKNLDKMNEYAQQGFMLGKAREYFINIARAYPRNKPIPDDKNMVIEIDTANGLVIIHSLHGTNANRTLALLLGYFLTEHVDFPLVGIDSDAYRIKLFLYKSPYILEKTIIKSLEGTLNVLMDIAKDKNSLEKIIREVILSTKLEDLQWYFVQVLRRFGIISSDKYLSRSQIMRLISSYIDTPVMTEALHEYIFNNLDIEKTIEVLNSMDNGDINTWFSLGLSSLALQVPILPQFIVKDVDTLVNQKYEERLLRKKLRFICLKCGYYEERTVSEGMYVCPKCKSLRITVAKTSDERLIEIINKALNKVQLTANEKQRLLEAEQIGKFLRAYRDVTSLVIATPGIGMKHAIDILKKYTGNRKELIRELRRREANYWKTRAFWE